MVIRLPVTGLAPETGTVMPGMSNLLTGIFPLKGVQMRVITRLPVNSSLVGFKVPVT